MASLRTSWRRQSAVLLDGDFPWGTVIAAPLRYGATQHRLIVYPPGITRTQRRWLRTWRGSPVWGASLWFILQICLQQMMPSGQAMAAAAGISVAAGVAAYVMAADTRPHVRTLNACSFTVADDPELLQSQRTVRLLATTLLTADFHHNRGDLTTVDYERIWGHVYDAMASERNGPG